MKRLPPEPTPKLTSKQIEEAFYKEGYEFRRNVVLNRNEVRFFKKKLPPLAAALASHVELERISQLANEFPLEEGVWHHVQEDLITYFQRSLAIRIYNESGSDKKLSDLTKHFVIKDAINAICLSHPVDVLKEYFEECKKHFKSLPPCSLLEQFLELVGVKDEFVNERNKFITVWLMGMVLRIVRPKSSHQNPMLVLIGKQGTGKTTFFQHLMKDLPKFYTHAQIVPGDAETYIKASTKLLWNCDELQGLNSEERKSLKSLLTTTGEFERRRKYGAGDVDMLSRASFAGTTNESKFLNDNTGNRRYLCLPIVKIDSDSLRDQFDVKGLFGEIYIVLEEQDFNVPDVAALQAISNRRYEIPDELEEEVTTWLEPSLNAEDVVFLYELKELASKHNLPKYALSLNLRRIVTKLGYEVEQINCTAKRHELPACRFVRIKDHAKVSKSSLRYS